MRIDNPILVHPGGFGQLVPIRTFGVTTAVASVDFTLPGEFNTFMFHVRDLRFDADDVEVYLRVSFDGGATFETGASAYGWYTFRMDTTTEANVIDVGDSEISLTGGSADAVGNAPGEGFNGKIWLLNPPGGIGVRWLVGGQVSWTGATGLANLTSIAGRITSQRNVNAIQFTTGLANIARGHFSMYGIR